MITYQKFFILYELTKYVIENVKDFMQADHRHRVVGHTLLKTLAFCHTDHIFSDTKPVILFHIVFPIATSWVFTLEHLSNCVKKT